MARTLWEGPPLPDLTPATKGDKTKEALFQAMGESMAACGVLEGNVAALYFGLIGRGPKGKASLRAFGAAEAFYTKRKMVMAAADSFFERYGDQEYPYDGKPTSHCKQIKNTCSDAIGSVRSFVYGIPVKGGFQSIDSLASSARSATLLGRTERSSPEARPGAPQARGLTASVRAERS